MMTPEIFPTVLKRTADAVDAELVALLAADPQPGELVRPARLLEAMRHGVLAGGKRLRPFLTVATVEALGGDVKQALRAGAAIELLHCYSLIHDDLPSMDDDDLRRGRPTVHRAYDEATAILAGDALQALAFATLADPAVHPDGAIRAALVAGLAQAAGVGGMVGGQMLDLAAEGRFSPDGSRPPLIEDEIRWLQAMKTGALLRFSVEAGALIAGADAATRDRLRAFGETVGLAFQIADDLLDVESTPEKLGKATAKDAARGKATLVSLHGAEHMRRILANLTAQADALVAPLGDRARLLKQAARFIAQRDH